MATREQNEASSTVVQNMPEFQKSLTKAEAFTFIHHETLASLLNLWDLAAQTVSEQLLPKSAWLPSRSGFGGLWSSELGVKIPRKGYLMP